MNKLALPLLLAVISFPVHAEFDRLTDLQMGQEGRVYSLPPASHEPSGYPVKFLQVVDSNQKEIQKVPVSCKYGTIVTAAEEEWPNVTSFMQELKANGSRYVNLILFCRRTDENVRFDFTDGIKYHLSYQNKADGILLQRRPGSDAHSWPQHYLSIPRFNFVQILMGRSWSEIPPASADAK